MNQEEISELLDVEASDDYHDYIMSEEKHERGYDMRHLATLGMVGWAGWDMTGSGEYVAFLVVSFLVGCVIGAHLRGKRNHD
jgi:hypothetical protein